MSTKLSARQICEHALRRIGAFSINDDGADGTEMTVALQNLDMELAELAGTSRLLFLVPDTLSITLTGGIKSYDIDDVLGQAAPDLGIQFPISASLDISNGNETPIEIVTRPKYEEIKRKDTTGNPEIIFIDRLDDPKMLVYPVPAVGVTTLKIKLVVQTFAPEFSGNGQKATSLRVAWNKWAVLQLAAAIGDGPVRQLPDAEVNKIVALAEASRQRLEAFENRDHHSYPRLVEFRDF